MTPRLGAAALSLLICAGCTGSAPSPSVPVEASASPAPASPIVGSPSPLPSSASTIEPTVAPLPSPSAVAAKPDRYPDWLIGKVLATRTAAGAVILHRLGLPERLELPVSAQVLGTFGDRIITAEPSADGTFVRILSFGAGGQVGEASELDRFGAYGVPFADGIVTERLEVISVDGSVRTLHDPGPVPTFDQPTRVVAVSQNGRRVATSICQSGIEDAFNCRPTSIIDIASGELLDTIDARDLPVIRFTSSWLFTRSFTGVAMVDPDGRELWSNDDLSQGATLWYLEILDGDVVAIAQGVDGIRETLVRVDALTGDDEVVFTEPDGEDWRFWTSWSTDRYVVLGHEDGPRPVASMDCEPCAPVITAGILDIETGDFDPDAISIDLTRYDSGMR